MPIYLGDKKSVLYKGHYRPVNLYAGSEKIAGWAAENKTGAEVEWNDTYDDKFLALEVEGTSAQNGVPAPTAPVLILDSGMGDLSSHNLNEDQSSNVEMPVLRSLSNGIKDTLEYLGKGLWAHIQRVGVYTATGVGSEMWFSYSDGAGGYQAFYLGGVTTGGPGVGEKTCRCSHVPELTTFGQMYYGTVVGAWAGDANVGANRIFVSFDNVMKNRATLKSWLAAQYAADTPVIFYYPLATPITTELVLGELATFPRYTKLKQTNSTKATLNATVRRHI